MSDVAHEPLVYFFACLLSEKKTPDAEGEYFTSVKYQWGGVIYGPLTDGCYSIYIDYKHYISF